MLDIEDIDNAEQALYNAGVIGRLPHIVLKEAKRTALIVEAISVLVDKNLANYNLVDESDTALRIRRLLDHGTDSPDIIAAIEAYEKAKRDLEILKHVVAKEGYTIIIGSERF